MMGLAGLVSLIPLISSALVFLWGKSKGEQVYRISNFFIVVTFLLSLFGLLGVLLGDYRGTVSLTEVLTFRIDPLSMLMATAVSGISLIVHFYSVRYMQDDPGYVRFYSLLDLITAAILLTVTAENLFLLFTGWVLTGTVLFFLLAHNRTRKEAVRYSLWTLVIQRVGDASLLLAIVLLGTTFGTYELSDLFVRIREEGESHRGILEVAGLLIVLSAFAKSAQVPFHLWLPYTMEGPTPVSALMHAGIVNAGGYIINRFAPVYFHAELGLHLAFLVGLFTAILGAVLMLMQADIKKSLGYSTVGQMGYMIMECGVGAFALAIYHLIAHGIFKATLFMGSGSVIHEARKDPNIPEDEVYKFFVERELPPVQLPWIFFAVITVIVPLVIVILAHFVAGVDVFKYQGAIILLFFGWITGAQTIFSIYRIGSKSVVKTLLFVIASFTVVILGYVVVGHSFEKFLYPDRELIERIYSNAEINPLIFEIQIAILTLVAVLGWFYVYYASISREVIIEKLKEKYLYLYSVLSRELFFKEMYEAVGEKMEEVSRFLNKLFRGL
ncbi:MAG: NADH-quinone oxidoreductase subunit L [Aquificae bacterium]|nr:NADH-quinone oxidoreductase subunit L [Aquificota bacterium]